MKPVDAAVGGLLGGACSAAGAMLLVKAMANPVEAAIVAIGVAGTAYAASDSTRSSVNAGGVAAYEGFKTAIGTRESGNSQVFSIGAGCALTGSALALATGAPVLVIAGFGTALGLMVAKVKTAQSEDLRK